MKRKLREPFFAVHGANLVLGMIGLLLFIISLWKDGGTEIYEILIFVLASVINAASAVVSFSEGKKIRGNICATLCTLFFITALIFAVSRL